MSRGSDIAAATGTHALSSFPLLVFSRSLAGLEIFHAYAASNGYNNMDSNQREASAFRGCASEYQKQRSHPAVSQGSRKEHAQRLLDGRGKEVGHPV